MGGGRDRGRPAALAPDERRPFDGAIHSHARARLRSSVRVRLLIPVLLAAAGVAMLGAVQISSALDQADRSDRSSMLATATGAVGLLAHEVAAEYVVGNAARRSGAPGTLEAQLRRTDAAVRGYQALVPLVVAAAPDLTPLTDGVQRAVDLLGPARLVAAQSPDGSPEVAAFYDQALAALLALAAAMPPQLDERELIQLARSVVLAAGLERLAALQLDLVSRGLARGNLQPSEQIVLAQWVGGERTLVEELTNLGLGGESYDAVGRSASSTTAASIRQVLLDDRTGDAVRGVSPALWVTTQTGRVSELWALEQRLAVRLDSEASTLGVAARDRAYLFASLSAAIVAVTLGGAIVMVVRISRRLRQTRYAALTAARIELPTAIANVIAARDAVTVRAALTDSSARIDAMLHSGRDEIGELATAFGAVHRQALRLAADQALMRMEVQDMFVALSRRGQTLVQRQIYLIDEFGREEADPAALARLFALDHLAARMRRNEENLLVLAGGEPGRWITRPIAIGDIFRAAAQEIEEYRRVDVLEVPDHAISTNVAGDAIHLVAELLENATSYSAPETRVRVTARLAVEGLVVAIHDAGIGMPPQRLAEANGRLMHPSALTSTLVGTMGLLVVARLAQRHGIAVRLDSVAGRGTTATLTLPDRLLMPLTEEDRLYSSRRLREPPGVDATAVAASVPSAAGTLRVPMQRSAPAATPEVSARREGEDEAEFTRTGLPRRPVETRRSDMDEAPPPPAGPDPEAVRARLASLARGFAAAASQDPSPR